MSNLDDLLVIGDSPKDLEIELPTELGGGLKEFQIFSGIHSKIGPFNIKELENSAASLFVVDSETEVVKQYSNRFYLSNIQETREEKAQIIETFGEPSLFFFGEKTRIYNFSGQLLETGSNLKGYEYKYYWGSSLSQLYNNYIRGSKLAERGYKIILLIRNVRLHGYIINLNILHSSNNPNIAGFSFSMIVTKHDIMNKDKLNTLTNISQFSDAKDIAEKLEKLSTDIDDLYDKITKFKPKLREAYLYSFDNSDTYAAENLKLILALSNTFEKHFNKYLELSVSKKYWKAVRENKGNNSNLDNMSYYFISNMDISMIFEDLKNYIFMDLKPEIGSDLAASAVDSFTTQCYETGIVDVVKQYSIAVVNYNDLVVKLSILNNENNKKLR